MKRHRHTRAADTHGLQERAWWPREQATTGCGAVAGGGGAVLCADHIPTCDTCACAAADCTARARQQRNAPSPGAHCILTLSFQKWLLHSFFSLLNAI